MSYDFEGCKDKSPPMRNHIPMQGNDLEAIVMLLELAAIYLTDSPDTEFTEEQLIAQAKEIGGKGIVLKDNDARIVLSGMKFIKKVKGKQNTYKFT